MAIGCFLGKAQFLSSVSKNQKESNIARTRRKTISYESGSAETWSKTAIVMSLLFISLLLGLGLRSFSTLIIDGDVESNPGPTYVIEKAICGSYHHGDRRFGDTAQVSNVHVILCMHYAGHKSGKRISGID